MKLRKEIIHFIAEGLAEKLVDEGLIETEYDHEELVTLFNRVITNDLMMEDRLNDEVRKILEEHSELVDKSNINYSEMFKMIKKRLIKERGLIL